MFGLVRDIGADQFGDQRIANRFGGLARFIGGLHQRIMHHRHAKQRKRVLAFGFGQCLTSGFDGGPLNRRGSEGRRILAALGPCAVSRDGARGAIKILKITDALRGQMCLIGHCESVDNNQCLAG